MNRVSQLSAVVVIVVLGACGGDDAQQQPTGPGPSGPTATTSVNIIDNGFSPSSNSATAGQSVTWSWTGNNPHNVTFDDPAIGNSSTKTSGGFTRSFPTAGSFTYFCTVHGRSIMSGTVTVN